jgi:predicted MFS family arabinose efflux permease
MVTHSSDLSRGRIWLMAAACGASVANLYYNQPMLGVIARSLHLTAHQVGLVPTLTQIGYALGLLFLAPLGDRLERKRLILVMTALLSLSLTGAAIAPSFLLLGLFSLLLGALSTIAQQIVPFAAQLAAPGQRGKVVGTVMSGLLIGILLARTLSGEVAAHAGWRTMYGIAAVAMVVLGLVLAWGLPRSRPTVSMTYGQLMRSLWHLLATEPALRESSLVGALMFGTFSVFWATLTLFLESPAYHQGADVAGLFGLVGAAGALAAPLAGRSADKSGPRSVLRLATLIVFVSFIIFGLVGHLMPGLILGVILMDLGVQSAQIANQARIYALQPEARSRLNTVYMVSYFIGGASGSLLGNLAWTRAGWTGVSWLGGVMALAAFGRLALVRRPAA